MDKQPVIQVDGMSKRFGSDHAISQISLQVKRGELFGIIGKDGAGKSTLLGLLSGEQHPDEGCVQVLDIDVRLAPEKLKEQLNIFVHNQSLLDKMTVREALETFQACSGEESDTDAMMKQYGLAPYSDRRIKLLSKGLRQRLLLALRMTADPALVLLDEPTTGLEPEAKREYWSLLALLRLQGKTVVIASHDMTEIGYHCDRVGIMKNGELVACGSPTSLIEQLPGGGMTMEAVYMHYAVGQKGGVEV